MQYAGHKPSVRHETITYNHLKRKSNFTVLPYIHLFVCYVEKQTLLLLLLFIIIIDVSLPPTKKFMYVHVLACICTVRTSRTYIV